MDGRWKFCRGHIPVTRECAGGLKRTVFSSRWMTSTMLLHLWNHLGLGLNLRLLVNLRSWICHFDLLVVVNTGLGNSRLWKNYRLIHYLTMGIYRTAEICPNGHVSTSSADAYPQHREKFCSQCGEKTTIECAECGSPLRGDYYVEGVFGLNSYTPPAFCHNCGNAFEWTKRKISNAVALVTEGDILTAEELAQFEIDLTDLTKNTPATHVASIRFNKYMSKLGSKIADGVKSIIVDVLSETAKKAILGQ